MNSVYSRRMHIQTNTHIAHSKRQHKQPEEEAAEGKLFEENHAFVVFDSKNINCIVLLKMYTRNCHANEELR